jgi:hypothetical protein
LSRCCAILAQIVRSWLKRAAVNKSWAAPRSRPAPCASGLPKPRRCGEC